LGGYEEPFTVGGKGAVEKEEGAGCSGVEGEESESLKGLERHFNKTE